MLLAYFTHVKAFMFQSNVNSFSKYYNVTENQIIWLAQIGLVASSVFMIPGNVYDLWLNMF